MIAKVWSLMRANRDLKSSIVGLHIARQQSRQWPPIQVASGYEHHATEL